jgi:hypothetical protein
MASLIKKPVNDVGTSERKTSPRINKNHGDLGFEQQKKPHTKLPSGGFTMEACVLADGSNCTAFVQKAGLKPRLFDVFMQFSTVVFSSF